MNEYLYDTTYDPPIPVCDVTLIAPAADRRVKLTAIVDTGADGTIVPIRYLEDIGARRAFEARLRSPLTELNKYAQKGGGIGSLNAMHPYFARRPLTASRAMTLAALVDAPGTDTSTSLSASAERKTLEELLIALSSEEWPDKPNLLQKARELIRQAHDGRAPRVLDPFAGGGSMPLEAMRLGCEATALDLNPVAYLALIASLVRAVALASSGLPQHPQEGRQAPGT